MLGAACLLWGSHTGVAVYGQGTLLDPHGSASIYPVDGAQVILSGSFILKTGGLPA